MLIEVVLNEALLNDYGRSPFWDSSYTGEKYTDLDGVTVPDYSDIQKYQMKKLEDYTKASLEDQSEKRAVDIINGLFLSGDINYLPAQNDKENELILDKVVTNLMNKFNDQSIFYEKNKNNNSIAENEYQQLNNNLIVLQKELINLKKRLSINSPIYNRYLSQIAAAVNECGLNSLNGKNITRWLKNISQIKGDILEELGVAWINKKIPQIKELVGYKAISTGKVNLEGTTAVGRHNGFLIQDFMTVDMSKLKLDIYKDIQVSYKLNGQDQESSLEEFFDKMENGKASDKIQIEDRVYDFLLELSSLNIQAKAGFGQKPWKNRKYNSVSIQEFHDVEGYNIPHIINLLQNLYNEDTHTGKSWVPDAANEYYRLVNFGLASVLNKVLSLTGQEGNQFLLTPSGFISYLDKIKQMYTVENGGIFSIGGKIRLSDSSILSQMRYVNSSTKFKA